MLKNLSFLKRCWKRIKYDFKVFLDDNFLFNYKKTKIHARDTQTFSKINKDRVDDEFYFEQNIYNSFKITFKN